MEWRGSLPPGTACDYKLRCRVSICTPYYFVVKHIALRTTNIKAVSVLRLLLICIYPVTIRLHQFTFVFHSRVFSLPPQQRCIFWYRCRDIKKLQNTRGVRCRAPSSGPPAVGRIGERSRELSIEEPTMQNLKRLHIRFEGGRSSYVHCWKLTAAYYRGTTS